MRPVESFLQLPDGCVVLLSEREADAMQVGVEVVVYKLLPDGCVVLLSEREADAMQELACELRLKGSTPTAQSPQLMLLCYAQQHHVSRERASSPSLSLSLSHQPAALPPVSADVLVSMGLLNGDTSFGEAQVAILRKSMTGKRESAEELVGMRGKQSLLPRSELDKVIN
eukprot:gene16365-22567_t